MAPEIGVRINCAFGGLIIGAVVVATIGFSPLVGWTTSAETRQRIDAEVVRAKAAVCLGQFKRVANYHERLKELKGLSYAEISTFLAKGGWDRMPGEDVQNDAVNRACLDGLEIFPEN